MTGCAVASGDLAVRGDALYLPGDDGDPTGIGLPLLSRSRKGRRIVERKSCEQISKICATFLLRIGAGDLIKMVHC